MMCYGTFKKQYLQKMPPNNRWSRPGYQESLGDWVGSAVEILSECGVPVPPGGSAPTVGRRSMRPDLRVVGINAESSAVTVLTGQVYLAQSVEGVTQMIFDC